jgi:hypothetical protein
VTDILKRIATRVDLLSYPLVSLHELVLGDARTIVLLADIGPETIATPQQALQWSMSIGAGSIALVKRRYVVRLCIAIDQVDTARWPDLARYASNLATSIATSFSTSRRKADVSGLSHYGG